MGDLISGSKLPIARHCAWWARDDAKFPKRASSDEANEGTRKHEAFASYIDHKVFPPLTGAQRIVAEHFREWWGSRILVAGWRTEIAYALNPIAKTSRMLGKDIHRKYIEHGLDPVNEIGLSVDYVWTEGEGIPTVGDFKTGYGAHVELPQDNLQMLAGGCAATLAAYGNLEKGCQLEIAFCGDDGVYPKRFFANAEHLGAALREIAWIFQTRAGAQPKAGSHCTYCPALGACPETRTALVSAAQSYSVERKVEVLAKAVFTTEFVSRENDALLVEQVPALEKMLEAVKDSLKERAKQMGGVVLPNGKVWRPVLCRKTSLDKEKVEEFLGDRLKDYQKTTEYEQFKAVKA